MQVATQFSIFLVNKPGVLASVCGELAEAKINILAMTMMDSSEHGVLRLVVEQEDRCRQVLSGLDLPTTEADVLLVPLPNKPGSIADVAGRLADEHINISYAYVTAGGTRDKALGVFRVADIKRAQKVLDQQPRRTRDLGLNLRRPIARH